MNKINFKELFKDVLYDIVGCTIYALGVNVFTAPNHIAPGGATGIATVVNYLFPAVQIGTVSMLINIPLLIAAFVFLGRAFTFKTFKSVAILAFLMNFFSGRVPAYTGNPLLAAVYGGLLLGVGMSIVLMRDSTTGGSDIACKLLQLKFPHIQMGRMLVILDVIIISFSLMVFRNLELGMYTFITVFTFSQSLDAVLYGLEKGKMALIISDKSVEISREIIERLGRGVTLLEAEGAYNRDPRKIALCAMGKRDFYKVRKLVQEVDPVAFVIVCDCAEIFGQGFKAIDKAD